MGLEKIFKIAKRERRFDQKETLNLLMSYGYKYFSWGCSTAYRNGNDGLLLNVNGHHHKGYVWIYLCYNDTYGVQYFDFNGNEVFESDSEIYFDELFDTIDRKIEHISEYQS